MDNLILNTSNLGTLVREARQAQGLNQEELSGLTGTGRRFISDLENGKETAHIGKVFLVLNALGIALTSVQKWKK